MRHRIAAVAAAATGIILASLTATPASAAPAVDRQRCQSATLFVNHTLCVTFQGDLYNADVVKMDVRASTSTGMGGHWELYGPRGTIKNSLDGEWRNRTHDWSGWQDGAHGDLWCAVFWKDMGGGSGYIKGTQPLCVTARGI
ncbi:hypothetical protein STAN_3373 [Streptomyces sp. CBMAI 2042]|uniref:hypothetical protein n=1 Tax=Streptomyces sp. CBMAI 2042 TaxID=2305222 RepID=UPI000F1EAA29|nr:hypothetical protein [Streptomyces sp. CBMAI 2042]RLV67849.1 hypothetical protein STAN_3373 [Streptomyces sp. CBMAI 2042]